MTNFVHYRLTENLIPSIIDYVGIGVFVTLSLTVAKIGWDLNHLKKHPMITAINEIQKEQMVGAIKSLLSSDWRKEDKKDDKTE